MTTSTNQLTPTTRRLVEENLPLVDHITKRVAATFPRHIDREELARAGMLGLVEAAIRFDPERGRFSTFAGRRIEGAILDEVRRRSWVPRSVRSAARGLSRLEEQLVQDLGRRPSEAELAAAAGLSVDELARHRSRAVHGYVDTLDRPAGPDGDATVADLVADASERAPDEQIEDLELNAYLRSAVANLPERHRLVIVGYFIEGRSMEELGRLLGVSQSRISQLKDFALDLMRGAIESQYRDGAAAPPQGRAQRSRAAYAAVVAADAAATRRPAGRSAERHPVAV